jgi:hypothetical protein
MLVGDDKTASSAALKGGVYRVDFLQVEEGTRGRRYTGRGAVPTCVCLCVYVRVMSGEQQTLGRASIKGGDGGRRERGKRERCVDGNVETSLNPAGLVKETEWVWDGGRGEGNAKGKSNAN